VVLTIANPEIWDMGNHKDEQVKVLDAKKISEFKKIISKWVRTPPGIEEFDRQLSEWLSMLSLQYSSSYPTLQHPVGQYAFPSNNLYPTTLAEALLWKLGKWNTFKTFVSNYANPNPPIPETGVVFYAFARHLAEEENPIFDQHALRAIWTICNTTPEVDRVIKMSLFDGNGNWKESGSGKEYSGCYKIFQDLIETFIPNNYTRNTLVVLDKFLMPLGQTIKDETNDLDEYKIVSGKQIV
jgi:hypothetical protein